MATGDQARMTPRPLCNVIPANAGTHTNDAVTVRSARADVGRGGRCIAVPTPFPLLNDFHPDTLMGPRLRGDDFVGKGRNSVLLH